MEASECGAACLAMVLARHGHHAPLAELRQACGVSRDGASALAILRAARDYGLEAEAVQVEACHLSDLPLPAVLHWGFNHFLVLERVGRRGAVLVDPEGGRREASREELDGLFTGVALVFAPGDGFQPRPPRRPSLARYADLVRQALPSLGQLLGASLMLQALGLFFPVANQILVDRVLGPRQEAWLWGLAFGMAGVAVARALVTLVRSWVIQGLQATLDFQLMARFADHLLRLPLGFFLQRQAGDLAQRVQSTAQVRNLFSSRSVSALLDGFLLAGYAGLMVAYNPGLAALVLAMGALRVGLMAAMRERNRQAMAAELASAGREGNALVEAFSALETVKATGAEARMAHRWAHRFVTRLNAGLERRRREILADQAMVLLQGLALALLFALGSREVLAERMSVGVFASFITLQGLFLAPLESLLAACGQLQYLGSHLARLDDVLETRTEPAGTLDPGRLEGAIILEGVGFRYGPGSPPVLREVDLAIRPGEKVALVGPSGAGKSTLARLVLGLHLPTEGRVRFDGRDLRELDPEKLRRRLGAVLQETVFFAGTLEANLRLGDPGIPLERLRWACERACVLDLVEALPEGFRSPMGENGGLFSGGQRQRLALARALAHDPAVLLLDEATSALDLETEARVHANLADLGCTRILIAHRLATVRDADRILVLQEGRVAQEGSFEALRQVPGPFRDLVEAMEGSHG
jgi:ABC-type bacteriocin/lantibiotic exporter with double-glycine peptidase domain